MKPVKILLVEDNEGDILLTSDALEECRIMNEVAIIRDGESAIEFFKHLKNKEDRPDLVLLDINIPKKSGLEVLAFLKTSENYKQIPVIMLTTSSSEKDVILSYKNYANCYITKPIEVSQFMDAITKIEEFWFNIVTIPLR